MKSFKFWISIAISAFFLYFAFRGMDFSELGHTLSKVSIPLVLAGVATYYINLVFRAWRWWYILQPIKKVGIVSVYGATIVGYMGNNVLPFRLGEIVRAVYISRRERMDGGAALGTIAVERIFDGITALVLLALVFFYMDFPGEKGAEFATYFKQGAKGLLITSIIALGTLMVMARKRELSLRAAEILTRPLPGRIRTKTLGMVDKFIDGLHILGSPLKVLMVAFLSALVWITNLAPIYFAGAAFGIDAMKFSLLGLFFLLGLGAVAASIPAAPGLVGTFHYACKGGVMILFAINPDPSIPKESLETLAMGFAIVLHALYIVTTTATGFAILAWTGIGLGELKSEAEGDGEGESLKDEV